MHHQVLTDVRVVDAGADEDRRGVDRPCAHGDGAGTDGQLVPAGRRRLDAPRLAVLDQDLLDGGVDDDPGSGVVGVLQPGLHGGLLRADRAAVVALAADVLGAAHGVPLHHLGVPAELREAGPEGEVAARGRAALGVDVIRSQTASRLSSKSLPAQSSRPKRSCHSRRTWSGGRKHEGVVDDRAAAQTAAREQAHALVGVGMPPPPR